ncbi:PQQ-dependent sugar dehydrogenase [Cellulomonas aerilata]|uniref:Oxidoreductase n=1 Tax=Cellulomonas aerilata TaxID=515326 RepID=A0A512DFU6_9CELL|nr:PQQ-dependent sugar dehydrogenase [Cellulomonas aerilata]GEO35358.1 oxidoreductase [Cellulomonas aerilata]
MDDAPARAPRRATVAVVALGLVTTLAACTPASSEPDPAPAPRATGPAAAPAPEPGAAAAPPDDVAWPAGPSLPPATAEPQDVVTDLASPWGLAFLPGGSALVTLRDAGEVVLLTGAGPRTLTGPGAEALATTTVHGGEAGLLGVAVSPQVADDRLVYLYRTAAGGNEVVRATLDPEAGTLGDLQPVLGGIPAAGNHDGGRLAFGPDGFLYVTTGDAGDRAAAQDPDSLAGKILRLTPDGAPAPGNPTAGSPVWSLGHRNVQGLAWRDDGTMVAGEFGQDTFDELNVVVPGGNYGWPEVEGRAEVDGFVDPVAAWNPDDASPSGVAVVGDTVYLAGLRGRRLLTVGLSDGDAQTGAALVDELGRLRHVTVGPDGALWVVTNNTDGRGRPGPGDDRIVRLTPP